MTAPTDFIEVPSGALCGASIVLTCKGPDEERSYVIEYDSQLDPDDYISGPITWTAGDDAITVTDTTPYGRRFRFTVSGGTLNMRSGIEFTIPLKSGDIRTLVCVMTIEAQGVLVPGIIPVIMGAQGARGTIIWTYVGNTVPPSNWEPNPDKPLRDGDYVLVTESHQIYEIAISNSGLASYTLVVDLGSSSQINPDTVITTATNSITIGDLVDQAALATKITDYFYITTKGNLAIKSDLISDSDPEDTDAWWYNGDFLTRSDG